MVLCKYFQQGCCRFGSSCHYEHAYSSKYSYKAPLENQNMGSSLFRRAVQSNTDQSAFIQNRGSVFNRLGNQPNAYVPNENHKAKSLFAQASQNIFGQTHTQVPGAQNTFASNAKSVFAQANRTTFGEVQNQNVMSQHTHAANIFATAASLVFAQQNNYSNSNIFKISERPTNVFSMSNNSFDQTMCDENVYSQLEDLSKSDIEAFQCAEFKLGCIPELPPPKTLCV